MSQCRTVVKMKFYDYRVLVQENTEYFFRRKYIFNLYDKIKSNIYKVIFFLFKCIPSINLLDLLRSQVSSSLELALIGQISSTQSRNFPLYEGYRADVLTDAAVLERHSRN